LKGHGRQLAGDQIPEELAFFSLFCGLMAAIVRKVTGGFHVPESHKGKCRKADGQE